MSAPNYGKKENGKIPFTMDEISMVTKFLESKLPASDYTMWMKQIFSDPPKPATKSVSMDIAVISESESPIHVFAAKQAKKIIDEVLAENHLTITKDENEKLSRAVKEELIKKATDAARGAKETALGIIKFLNR